MRGFLHVQNLVNCKCARLAKTFSALVTFERFFFGMDVTVISQMVLSSERLSTDITIEWSLIGMCPLVNQEVVRFGKLPVAVLANKTLLWSGSSPWSSQQSGIIVWWVDCRKSGCCRSWNTAPGRCCHTGRSKPVSHQERKSITWWEPHSHVCCSHGIG